MLCDKPNARPTCCRESNNRNLPGRKILLVTKIGVGGNQHLESTRLGKTQQLSVFQSDPPKLISCADTVTEERLPQRNRCSLIKQDAHLCGQQS